MPSTAWYNRLGLVATNQMMREICVFGRNIIIARLIGAEQLGEFIFLILAIRLFAMSTDLAVDRYILQVDQKDTSHALAAAHLFIRGRSVILALLLAVMGLYGVQHISFACYGLLAGSAILRGFTHQGYRLKQRTLNFRPALYVEASTTIVATIAMYVVATHVPTLEAVCAVLLAQSGMHTALSHILSDDRYRAYASDDRLKHMFGFGWPLMLSGITMFWSMQGERVILSAMLSAEDFAHFSMMFQLALVPVLVVGRVALTAGLPALAAVANNHAAFQNRLDYFHLYIYGVATVFVLGFVFLANPVLGALFGPAFETSVSLLFLVALAQSLRLCRQPQSVAAQALGHTDIPFKANLVRVSAVLFAVVSVALGGSLMSLLVIACVGEGVAWAAQALLFSMRTRGAARARANVGTGTPQETLS